MASRVKQSLMVLLASAALVAGCGDGASAGSVPASSDGVSAQRIAVEASPEQQTERSSDTKCTVVLRDVARPSNGAGGYEVERGSAGLFYVWTGSVDVATAAHDELEAVGVQYRSSEGSWYAEWARQVAGAPKGFVRYAFRLATHTVQEGVSMSALMRTRIELIPFIRLRSGAHIYDHNRFAGPFDNYVLSADNAWSLREDPLLCPGVRASRTELSFGPQWTTEQRGVLVSGGTLVVNYALERLPLCRGTHNGFPAWATTAYARFLPGGQVFEAKLNAFKSDQGRPTNEAYSVPAEFSVPSDAVAVELWFVNASGAGNNCQAYDSNSNANYRLGVAAEPPAAVTWAGDWGGSFTRECAHSDGLGEPVRLDGYTLQRACTFVDADVYAAGFTDVPGRAALLFAQVEYRIDGGPALREPLRLVGQVGSNARFRWELPRQELSRQEWSTVEYTFRFSTDGASWHVIGLDEGPAAGRARTLVRVADRGTGG